MFLYVIDVNDVLIIVFSWASWDSVLKFLQKIFHAEIVVDNAKVAKETKAYKPIPVITDFLDENGNDNMDEMIKGNYINIKNDVKQIVKNELERIANDENLCHLLSKK